MLHLKLFLLIVLSAAGQGIARLPAPRMTHKPAGTDERISRDGLLQQLEAMRDRLNGEQKASQLRLERLRAARNETDRATKDTEAMLNEKLEEIERLRAEFKPMKEHLDKLQEQRRGGPGEFEPQLRPILELEPIETKPFNPPRGKIRVPPPQIDDMPPLGPLAVAESEALAVLA
jgi:hypothetical protein